MRRAFWRFYLAWLAGTLALLAALCMTSHAQSTPSVATVAAVPTCASATSCAVTVTAGQSIWLDVLGTGTLTFTDSASTPTLISAYTAGTSGTYLSSLYVVNNATAGTHTFTATWSGAAQALMAFVVNGAAASPVDGYFNGQSVSSSLPQSGTFTTTGANELILGFDTACCGYNSSSLPGTTPQSMTTGVIINGTTSTSEYGNAVTPGSNYLTFGNGYGLAQTVTAVGILGVPGTYAPVASPAAGAYTGTQSVTLTSATSGASIYYTLDGSTPTAASTLYSGPVSLSASYPVNAVAIKSGLAPSYLAANYVIGAGTLLGISLGVNGSLNGYVANTSDAFHTDISAAAVDPNSATILANTGFRGAALHPDFGSIAGGNAGIPYNVVDSRQTPFVAVASARAHQNQGDFSYEPVPASIVIESLPPECPPTQTDDTPDYHGLILDRYTGTMYENWQMQHCGTQAVPWSASTPTMFDLTNANGEKRPYAYTSADAAGLSIFDGLLRYDEIVAGVVNHAIRFTLQRTQSNGAGGQFLPPAVHAAGQLSSGTIIGTRIRLKASFDVSSYSAINQIILAGMKKYGMILADNGGDMFFQGTPDARWNDNDLNALKTIHATDFEVIPPYGTVFSRTTNPTGTIYDASNYPAGTAATITSFTAASNTINAGQCTTLSLSTANASYSFIDKTGLVRGAQPVCPTATTTYTAVTMNSFLLNDDGYGDCTGNQPATYTTYGCRDTRSLTVTVNGTVPPITIPRFGGGGFPIGYVR